MSMVSMASIGTAAAYESRTDCIQDKGLAWSLTCTFYYDEITSQSEVVEFGEKVEDSEAWSTIDVYNSQIKDVWSNYNLTVQNYQQILKQEGVQTYRNAILNGSTEVEARKKAVESIDNMSDELAKNMVSYTQTAMQDLGSAASAPNGGLRDSSISSLNTGVNVTYFYQSVQLPSGDSSVNVSYIAGPNGDSGPYNPSSVYLSTYNNGFIGHAGISGNDARNEIRLSHGGFGDVDHKPFESLMTDLYNHRDDAVAEIDNLKSNTNESYFEGNATLPPSEMSKYAAENHTGYTAALLAQDGKAMSLDIKTDVMRTAPSGATANYSGILGLSDSLKAEPETDNLSAGDSFDVGALNGNAFFVDETGTQHTWTDGTITIKSTDADNATLGFTEYSYDATASYDKNLEELRAYQEATENASTYEGAYGGGIGGGGIGDLLRDPGPLGVSWIVWIIGVVLVFAVGTRD
jgi:hypothetical protein